MKILFHHRSRAEGAEGIHINEIIYSLRKLGHQVFVVSPLKDNYKKGDLNSKRDALKALKKACPKVLFRIGEIFYNLVDFFKLLKAIICFKPDFIYERYALFHFIGSVLAHRVGVPIILEVNTPYAVAWEKFDKIYFPKLAKSTEKFIFLKVDAIVCVSHALKEYLVNFGICGKKITPMHNGVNLKKFNIETNGNNYKEILNIEVDKVVVGFVGSLRIWHGVDLLMNTILNTCRKNDKIHYLIVGDGELKNDLTSFIEKNGLGGMVTLEGSVSHEKIQYYIATMDIALMPNSNSYGSPMKIFEYMAMGKAVIAPRLQPIMEIIDHDKNGYLVSPGEQKSLQGAIEILVENGDKRISMGNLAREKVVKEFSWDENAKKIVEMYRGLKDAK